MNKIKVRNTHIHLTGEQRGDHLTNRCLTADVRVNGFYLKGWRDETWLDVSYKAVRGLSKIEMYQGSDAFEIDIILKKKPSTNVFIYKIQTESLNFWYQPSLTEKEIKMGCVRPENVVGSYAVYHKTKKHNFGNKNYGTGKFCHIYRPKAYDSNGNSVWCDLNIDVGTNIMTVTVPQDFLDNAAYPVRIDPEFGHKAYGASSLAQDDSDPKMFLNREDNESLTGIAGTIIKLFWYGYPTFSNTVNAQMAVYDKDAGDVTNSALVATSNVIQPSGTDWHEHTISLDVTPDKIYMIGIASDYITGASPSYGASVYYDTIGYDGGFYYDLASTLAFSDPLGSDSGALPNACWSLYGEYTESLPETDTITIQSDACVVDPHIFTFANPTEVTTIASKNYLNPTVFDIKLKHVCNHKLSSQFKLSNCPRCLGTGYYYDIKFNEMGRLIEVSLEDKLQQALEKLVLTEENKFHEDVAIDLKKWLGKVPISKVKAIIKQNIIEGVATLKDAQKSTPGLSPRAQIASIDSIIVTILGVSSLHYITTIMTVSGKTASLEGVINLSDAGLTD